MIDISKYEGLNEVIDRIINSDEIGIDDLLADSMVIKDGINELLAEVERLREENEQLRKADWEYECLWTWLDENTNLLNTIEPLVEEWKKEMIE